MGVSQVPPGGLARWLLPRAGVSHVAGKAVAAARVSWQVEHNEATGRDGQNSVGSQVRNGLAAGWGSRGWPFAFMLDLI